MRVAVAVLRVQHFAAVGVAVALAVAQAIDRRDAEDERLVRLAAAAAGRRWGC